MIYEILDSGGNVENRIEASQEFVEQQHPGAWRLAEVQPSSQIAPESEWSWYIDQGPFADRLGPAASFAIDTSSDAPMVVIRSDFARRKWIDLKDARVIASVQYLAGQPHAVFGTLAQPLLTPAQVDAVLNTPVDPVENLALRRVYFSA